MPMKKFTDKNFDIAKRRITEQGYLVAPARLARTGTLTYLGGEIDTDGTLGLMPEQEYQVNRLPNDVFADDAIKSFEGMPITITHPDDDVDAANWKENAVGTIRHVHQDGEFLVAEAWIYDQKAIELIEKNGIKELSCGYSSRLIDDDTFDFRQTEIRGNHVALVPSGRAGVDCRLGDERLNMTKVKLGPIARLLDVIGIRLTDEQKKQVSKLDKKTGEELPVDDLAEKKRARGKKKEVPLVIDEENETLEEVDLDEDDIEVLREQLKEAKTQIAELKATLSEQKNTEQVARDAIRFVPGLNVNHKDSARNIRMKVVLALEPSYHGRLLKMSDAALEALYVQETTKKGRAIGSALLQDHSTKKMDYNVLYRSEK